MTRYDAVTFGSATIDVFAQTSDSDAVHLCTDDGCEDLLAYHPGDKVLLEGLHVDVGGGGTNTAAALKKLGRSVAYAGCLGRDEHAEDVLSWLDRNDIAFAGTRSDQATNTSIILDSHELHDRTILAYRGASDQLRIQDLDLEALQATWWYFPSMVGASYQAMLELMRHANEHEIAVAFNPSSYQAQHGLDALREPLQRSQLFVLNKQEAQMLVGEGDRAQLCRRLRAHGGEIVVVTEAQHGASMLYADTIYHVDSRAEDVVETTGAGDCFSATLLAGLMHGLDVPDCLRLASVNAEHLITQVGAKNGLLSLADIRSRADDRPVTQEQV